MTEQLSRQVANSKPTTSSIANWHILKTKPRAEELVNKNLGHYKINVYMPKLYKQQKAGQHAKVVTLFPGYIFFQMEMYSSLWTIAKWAPGVSYILKGEDGPLIIPEQLILEIMRREEIQFQSAKECEKQKFEPDQPLKIIDGPLSGLDAVFSGYLSTSNRVQVLVNILGRLTLVKLESSKLELI